MADLFMVQNRFDQMISRYKSMKHSSITSNDVEYKIASPNEYIIDDVKLKIKYDGKDVTFISNLSDLFTVIMPGRKGIYKNIPIDFVDAYNKSTVRKSSNVFDLPLLRMIVISFDHVEFKMVKAPNYNHSIMKIFEQLENKELGNMSESLTTHLLPYVESKMEFIIHYRATKLFSSIGKTVTPDPVQPYVLDKYMIDLNDELEGRITISDTGSQLDYTHIIILLDNKEISLKQIKLETNHKPKKRTPITATYGNKVYILTKDDYFPPTDLQDNEYVLTKEHAELHNIPFQTSDTSYLLDIKQYINCYVKLFINNRIEKMSPEEDIFEDKFNPEQTTSDYKSFYERQMEFFNNNITEHKQQIEKIAKGQIDLDEPVTKLKLYLTLTFDMPYKGSVTVYLF
jgi:hypothetical protein